MRAAARWRLLVAAGLLATTAHAQTTPAPSPDSVKKPPPTFVADTARHVVVVNPAEPTTEVTRRTGLRIGVAIVVLTLTTLLLYNVRSR
ncbi:hypothetical protein [Hymenobacter sp. UYCo722]|uniref:hypothetical protein n=1 Tax=Hymenobacter sp. UYCo722 TaxID=3156335 RepID=UPI003397BAB8